LVIDIYFGILVGLEAHYSKVSSQLGHSFELVLSISMAILMVIFSIGIVCIFIFNIILLFLKSETKMSYDAMKIRKDSKNRQTFLFWLIRYFIDNDPLYFKIETILIVIVVFLVILVYSIGIASVIENSSASSPIVIARTTIQILLMISEIVAFGGFIFIISLKNYISSGSVVHGLEEKDEEDVNEMVQLLRNEFGYQIVFEFCQKELSLENVLLWKDLEKINAMVNDEERKVALQQINELYIKSNSERELNIDFKRRKAFLSYLELKDPTTEEIENAIRILYSACLANLAVDTLKRLKGTKLYESYLEVKENYQELSQDFVSNDI